MSLLLDKLLKVIDLHFLFPVCNTHLFFLLKKTLLSFTIINIATMKRFCCHVGYRKFISAKKNKKKII